MRIISLAHSCAITGKLNANRVAIVERVFILDSPLGWQPYALEAARSYPNPLLYSGHRFRSR
ncbi:Uncharacterised protein [Vibrio cholerae]|nr:Uncharacterised protein [Vibrio cholerae]